MINGQNYQQDRLWYKRVVLGDPENCLKLHDPGVSNVLTALVTETTPINSRYFFFFFLFFERERGGGCVCQVYLFSFLSYLVDTFDTINFSYFTAAEIYTIQGHHCIGIQCLYPCWLWLQSLCLHVFPVSDLIYQVRIDSNIL